MTGDQRDLQIEQRVCATVAAGRVRVTAERSCDGSVAMLYVTRADEAAATICFEVGDASRLEYRPDLADQDDQLVAAADELWAAPDDGPVLLRRILDSQVAAMRQQIDALAATEALGRERVRSAADDGRDSEAIRHALASLARDRAHLRPLLRDAGRRQAVWAVEVDPAVRRAALRLIDEGFAGTGEELMTVATAVLTDS
jgi:hypothetical protein